jgi:nitroreductase
MVERLIQAAVYIPSGGNSHSYRFTVITQGQQRKCLEQQLKTIYTFRRRLLKNPVLSKLFALVSDKKTRAFLLDDMYLKRVSYLLDQYERGEDPVFYAAPLIVIVHTDALVPTPGEDAILAAYNMILMAQTMGLGSCFVSLAQNAINASRRCKKLLNLGSGEQVHAVVVLGHPDVSFHRAIPREAKQFEYIN